MIYTPKHIIRIMLDLLSSGRGADLTEAKKYIEKGE